MTCKQTLMSEDPLYDFNPGLFRDVCDDGRCGLILQHGVTVQLLLQKHNWSCRSIVKKSPR